MLRTHVWGAAGMACLFGAGMLLAIPVHRRRIGALLALPRFFARMLHRILKRNPSTVYLATFIFLFNGTAIFLYMLSGVAPRLPAVVAFFTGLNVALTSIMAQKELPRIRQPAADDEAAANAFSVTAQLGAALTFVLELPCLWFALAMGMSISPSLAGILRGEDTGPLRERVLVYVMIILPALAISALAEAHAVCSAFRAAGGSVPPQEDG